MNVDSSATNVQFFKLMHTRNFKHRNIHLIIETDLKLSQPDHMRQVTLTRVSSFFLKFIENIEIIDFFKTQHFI